MKTSPILAAAALCITCVSAQAQVPNALAAASPVSPSTATLKARAGFVEALALYRAGRWSAAYGRFIEQAAKGDADAARFALMMLRHGNELYGTEWTAAPSQVALWERMVGSAAPLKLVYLGE
jgi:hypothetical protein